MMNLHMVVEQTKEYKYRMIYDPITKTFSESDRVSLSYVRKVDQPYGWIQESGTPPEPHWDVILMTEDNYELGDVIEIKLIGVFERYDGDNKFLAVTVNRDISDYEDLTEREKQDLKRLYPIIGENEGWRDRKRAEYIYEHNEKAL